MTEPLHQLPRIDLRGAVATPDDARVDRIMQAVCARVAGLPRALADDLATLRRARRHLLMAAAVFAGIAAASMIAFPRRGPAPSFDRLGDWARESHVPTNAELLAVFQGYSH